MRELPELPTKRKLSGHDTFRRVLSAMNQKSFSAALFKLTHGLHEAVRGELFVISSIRVESRAPQKRETRLFISSLLPKADHLATIVRSHWTTENRQHWSLDVSFGKDAKRARDKNKLANFAALTRLTLRLLRQEMTRKTSIARKRFLCGLGTSYLLKVLKAAAF